MKSKTHTTSKKTKPTPVQPRPSTASCLGTFATTNRGFVRIEFADQYDAHCSLQMNEKMVRGLIERLQSWLDSFQLSSEQAPSAEPDRPADLTARAKTAKSKILECGGLVAPGQDDRNVLFMPSTPSERLRVRLAVEPEYDWPDFVADLPEDAIMGGEISDLLSYEWNNMVSAVRLCDDPSVVSSLLTAVRKHLSANPDLRPWNIHEEVRHYPVSEMAVDFLAGDVAAEDLDEKTVKELERIAYPGTRRPNETKRKAP